MSQSAITAKVRACFKAYDIRGQVPEMLDADVTYAIGRAFVDEIGAAKVVVGHDVRLESPMLSEALIRGLCDAGADVIDIGLCGTEEVYFQTFHRETDGVGGGIMITASHNPKGYNGMKLVREGARPVSGDTGLFAVRDRVISGEYQPADRRGNVIEDHDKTAYIEHLLGYVDVSRLKPLTIVADPGNGGAGPVMRRLEKYLPFKVHYVHEQPDGNFPNGVPNPLLPEMRSATSKAVAEHGADLGIAWDGDFDRCFLFDAKGRFIEGYYLVGLLAETLLAKHPGAKIIHDPRLTWNTIEQVREAGGIPVQSKTGHAFIKQRMREEDAVYGGEMSAHHYFREFAYCDSGMIPWLLIGELMSASGKTLADLVDERMAAYPCSGEINCRVEDVPGTIERVLARFLPQNPTVDRTDGVSVEFPDWRFNLRGSNTEPLLRLNVEVRNNAFPVPHLVDEIEAVIQGA
ncbi:phosphohexomutase domain-containing protein [Acidihalobacter prosperus]|uniref:phosphomannomutase n=1 Tax=Acidihalobacter prosperus TaxID=160660 RepID=A0A1A6C604_9GAMM|nr:phosphomannomutase/phosphoglucomutase [Acidihalobacter prosperus]OBS09994.1 Phosphomannomutase [Acidihalobacter prosperus]